MKYDSAFIDGAWVPVAHDALTLVDPATEEPFATLSLAGPTEVDVAVAAARAALPGWRTADRVAILGRVWSAIESRRAEFAALITRDMGCPPKIADAVQVGTPLAVLDGLLGLAAKLDEHIGHSLVVHEPIGVVGAITPWNYPLHQVMAKVGPALLAGCTVVLKPSELAPSAALLLADVFAGAGLPSGVLNVVVGTGPVVGAALAAHPDVDMISFTGSTAAGKLVARAAADTVKRVALELGGKSASVVLPDADLTRAVKTTVSNAFLNSGQTCTAWTRLVVPAQLHDSAVSLAGEFASAMAPRLGPLASLAQFERVQGYLSSAPFAAVTGGPGRLRDRGYFCKPTVYADVDRNSAIAQEEIFGPVLAVIPYSDTDDAVAIANGTPYGLAGAVWSGDPDWALAVARRLRTGQVDINGARFNPLAPFGGYGQSGNGRELGRYGLDEFFETKSIQL
ncbi:aldehyde dehydrogenase [Asanoa ishikariensis]|uniref:aldehyde dehydrogenase (NAD(+)) n=1 Tax=Asanoa ishikariensis TaxID=137265 RepID=A0A1H3S210_9ACTN|nr:aldehyde dehydrogenase family protein [Asanoa ishikariensis]GIF66622.1 aldehyde dehydrogenase [Asanoa ishikariensis]SDZ31501.1 aldehyde dehydrogenase (NAD+)/betaine-aldehyde dehydrogenase [Asanoa ishikariensis]